MSHIPNSKPNDGKTRAVVLGCSMSGLLAARVLNDHFDEVLVLERDQLPGDPGLVRRGLPQAHHQHLLMVRGQRTLERLFPGFDADLAELGAPRVDQAGDCVISLEGQRAVRFESGLPMRLSQRSWVDWVLAKRVRDLPRVRVLEGVRALGLLTEGKARVIGVAADGAEGRFELHADWVVDATGRHSKVPKWLSQMGRPLAREDVVDANLGYASRLYTAPDTLALDFKGVEVTPRPPDNPRACGLWMVGEGLWLATLAGAAGCHPPSGDEGFLDFARALPDPLVYATLLRFEPLTKVRSFRGTANQWRHYEAQDALPDGLVPVGDAFCAFNPIYGQGMTMAAVGADHLEAALSSARSTRCEVVRPRFFKALTKDLRVAWMIATAEDARWPTTTGVRRDGLTRLSHAYVEAIRPLAPRHPELLGTLMEITNMVRSPLAMASPRMLASVVGTELRQRLFSTLRARTHG